MTRTLWLLGWDKAVGKWGQRSEANKEAIAIILVGHHDGWDQDDGPDGGTYFRETWQMGWWIWCGMRERGGTDYTKVLGLKNRCGEDCRRDCLGRGDMSSSGWDMLSLICDQTPSGSVELGICVWSHHHRDGMKALKLGEITFFSINEPKTASVH